MKPDGIDWSNIPDYFSIPDFFDIARQCSTEGTKHTFHLMNWIHKIFGTSLVDYVPFHENYGRKGFKLNGFFRDKSGTLFKLVEELRNELSSRAKSQERPLPICEDLVSSMSIMDLSTAALSFRLCDTFMNFMFEKEQVKRKSWKKAEMAVFD